MSSKWYGSISNRIEEGKNYNEDKLIHEGDDITEYLYSDCRCYYVTKVVNQKNIFIHPYHVCADHHKEGGMGHQNWLYFKTAKEMHKYLNDCIDEGLIPCEKENINDIIENDDIELVYRYNHWNYVTRVTPEVWNKRKEEVAERDLKKGASEETIRNFTNWYFGLNEEEIDKVEKGETVVKYQRMHNKISFGVRNYYYDWSF